MNTTTGSVRCRNATEEDRPALRPLLKKLLQPLRQKNQQPSTQNYSDSDRDTTGAFSTCYIMIASHTHNCREESDKNKLSRQ